MRGTRVHCPFKKISLRGHRTVTKHRSQFAPSGIPGKRLHGSKNFFWSLKVRRCEEEPRRHLQACLWKILMRVHRHVLGHKPFGTGTLCLPACTQRMFSRCIVLVTCLHPSLGSNLSVTQQEENIQHCHPISHFPR